MQSGLPKWRWNASRDQSSQHPTATLILQFSLLNSCHSLHCAMSNTYQRLPTDDTASVSVSAPSDLGRPINTAHDEPDYAHRPLRAASQAEFHRQPPSWWKRAALIFSLVFMVWLTLKLGGMGREKPKVIYASRFVCSPPVFGPNPRNTFTAFALPGGIFSHAILWPFQLIQGISIFLP